MTGWNLHIGMVALIVIAFSLLFTPAMSQGDVIPPSVADARATDPANEPEPLEKDKPVERALAAGEVHAYALKLDAYQTVTVLLEKRGVAAVVTLFAPNGKKVGIFGSAASSQGKEQIDFVAESAGNYRIAVRTFFKPSPPGHYVITLADVHASSAQEKSGLAKRSCEEKIWFDSENNFLVNTALESLSQCMTAVGHRLQANYPQAVELVDQANQELKYLVGRWRWGEFVSPAYQESLLQDFSALSVAAGDSDSNRAGKIVELVVEDIRIKAEHCRNSNSGLGPRIVVTVATKRGTQEDKGWFVFYKSGLHEDQQGFARRFPQQSSPTSTEMAPSRYFFWLAERDDSPEPPRGKQKEFVVGKGLEKHQLDLSVP